MTINRERLREMASWMRANLKPKNLDMEKVITEMGTAEGIPDPECGSVCCALGWGESIYGTHGATATFGIEPWGRYMGVWHYLFDGANIPDIELCASRLEFIANATDTQLTDEEWTDNLREKVGTKEV